jgi:CubicO group peptidase (beta-lactamase class C family)
MLLFGTSCHVGRFFYWNYADINDYKKFPAEQVETGGTPFHFRYPDKFIVPELPEKYQNPDKPAGLSSFLDENQTVAFLIIRNDTVLFEEYFGNYHEAEIIPSFSVSKSFVSALMGIAIDEGFIQSVNQPITDFVPELLENDPRFGLITLENLLNMRSGIRFNEGYSNPFADMAKYYYGTNLNRYITKLKIDRPPDEVYDYISVNKQLMGMAIERATGRSLAELLQEKIWLPLGMEYDASWSMDSDRHRQIKAFCCINGRAADFARFGRLYLNHGNWNGKQVVPERWVKRSMSIVNDSRDSQGYPYTYQWRVKEDGAIFAKGVLGQYIYVYPEKNIIIVRMGKKDAGVLWPDLFEQLCRGL